MTEKEKMLSGELYHLDDALIAERNQAQQFVFEYNTTSPLETALRYDILERLLASIGKNSTIEANFHCEYGKNITIGDNVFINFNFVVLDCNKVTIGNNVFIAPNVGIYAVTHPIEANVRNQMVGLTKPVTICDGVWIGGGVSIMPGLTIGKNSVIGAGSVVTKDIPENVVVIGSPCRVLRKLD